MKDSDYRGQSRTPKAPSEKKMDISDNVAYFLAKAEDFSLAEARRSNSGRYDTRNQVCLKSESL